MHDDYDKQCVAGCMDGRPDEFKHLIARYEAAVRAYLSGRLFNRTDVEDATQETFVRAYLALGRLREPYCFPSWLLGVAANVAKEAMRKERREILIDHSDLENTAKAAQNGDAKEVDAVLRRSIAGLSEPYREVILLRYYAGLSCEETAARLSKPVGTVTKTLSRAYQMLRAAIEREEFHHKEK
jgi:RNA polymerase sigma-70 factor, ECF subfamily